MNNHTCTYQSMHNHTRVPIIYQEVFEAKARRYLPLKNLVTPSGPNYPHPYPQIVRDKISSSHPPTPKWLPQAHGSSTKP